MATKDNLGAAFAGESMANRKYTAFAKKAQADGFPQIAKLFRAAAAAETVHALTHLRVMEGVKSTGENLQVAIEGEGYEFREMYPKFLDEARKERNQAAVQTFDNALKVEKVHHALYTEALKTQAAGKDLPATKIFVCSVCGNTVYGQPPAECPVCGSGSKMFDEIA